MKTVEKNYKHSSFCLTALDSDQTIWINQNQSKSLNAYCWEGALSKYFPKFEVLWLLFLRLWRLRCLLRLAARCTIDTTLWGGALHAGTVATACAWDSKWRAGVRVVSYHWWMRAWTDDNTGLNGHNIILEKKTTGIRQVTVCLNKL